MRYHKPGQKLPRGTDTVDMISCNSGAGPGRRDNVPCAASLINLHFFCWKTVFSTHAIPTWTGDVDLKAGCGFLSRSPMLDLFQRPPLACRTTLQLEPGPSLRQAPHTALPHPGWLSELSMPEHAATPAALSRACAETQPSTLKLSPLVFLTTM